MPQGLTVKTDPRPEWTRPETASVFDSPLEKAVRMLVSVLGLDDPNTSVQALMNPLQVPGKLAMDTASRLARAKALGYDVEKVWYRGRNEVTPDLGGTARRPPYFSDDPAIASAYADETRVPAWSRSEAKPNVVPVFLKKNAERADFRGQSPLAPDNDIHGGLLNRARQEGKDVVIYDNFMDIFSEQPQRQAVALKPNAARSIWAAFDPAKADSSDLLASVIAALAGLGGTAAAGQER
jgi:hypothetical protein